MMSNPKKRQRTGTELPVFVHPIPPCYDRNAEILILGSFPSVRSRETGFFYGHPQNRFWKVLAAVFEDALPETVEEKKAFLLRHKIALWDVIASCRIEGSADSSITDVRVNDLSELLSACRIRRIYVNGKAAEKLYRKYLFHLTGREAVCLPSSSAANAACSLERLVEFWKVLLPGDESPGIKE